MTKQRPQQALNTSADSLITSHSVEHPLSMTRRIKVGLTLAGAAAAAVFALAANLPVANADTVDLPDFPNFGDIDGIDVGSLAAPPWVDGIGFQDAGVYTNLLGVNVDGNQQGVDPFGASIYAIPGNTSEADLLTVASLPFGLPVDNPGIETLTITDPTQFINFNPGDAFTDGSTFNAVVTASGWDSLYEDTPFFSAGSEIETQNYSDTMLFDPTGSPLADPSGIEFGVQYLDLPDAATPVDALNFFGPGGEILFSIPVVGDLLSLF
jgi:hypothetical protein